jgi:lysozyme family protein
MTRFAACLPLILAHEGGFVNDPHDAGGPTNLGVTQASLSAWLGYPASIDDVKALTPATVAPIYAAHYWRAAGCDHLPPGPDYMTMDLSVNSGPGRAIRFLQEAVGVEADGVLGPHTMAAVAAHAPTDLVRALSAHRAAFYRAQPNFPTFGKGWLARLAEVTSQALAMAA